MSAAESGGVASDIDAHGFATRQLLSPSEVSDLRDDYAGLDVDAQHEFFASTCTLPVVPRSRWTAALRSVIGRACDEVLPGFEPFLAAFISKGARHGDRVEYHQDWTYTDERRARAIVVWVPLVDVSPGQRRHRGSSPAHTGGPTESVRSRPCSPPLAITTLSTGEPFRFRCRVDRPCATTRPSSTGRVRT